MVERTSARSSRPCAAGSATGRRAVTRQPLVARRAEELLGSSVIATAPVAGGDISTATQLRLSNGTTALMKTHPHAPEGFFEREAPACAGSARPRAACRARGPRRRPRVPGPALGRAGQEHRRRGRRLRPRARAPRTRPAPPSYGAGRRTASSAGCRCPTGPRRPGPSSTRPGGSCPTSSWPATAARSPRTTPRPSRRWSARLADLVPEEPPARLHGDLWNGNVLWGLDGACRVIDPAAYGGHREVDLAMLALFGLPHLPRVLDAYDEAAPLADGWEERVGAAPAVPAARARLPVRRRVRRPRGRRTAAHVRLATPRGSQRGLRLGWHSRAVSTAAAQAARPRRRRRPGGARVAAAVAGVQRVRRAPGRRRRRGARRDRRR